MVAAGALVRLVGCQAVRPLGVWWAAPRVCVGSERAGAGAEWSLHLCCIKGLHRRHARAPRNTAGGHRHTGPAQGKHPPKKTHPPTYMNQELESHGGVRSQRESGSLGLTRSGQFKGISYRVNPKPPTRQQSSG